mmetsp:Transcript_50066/g.128878  ORF Transcript_50066/g.128878 Transcript_50066/m.128878 type:complete len:95 (+) Transcript_50066:1077-1361(+)
MRLIRLAPWLLPSEFAILFLSSSVQLRPVFATARATLSPITPPPTTMQSAMLSAITVLHTSLLLSVECVQFPIFFFFSFHFALTRHTFTLHTSL